MFKVLHRILVIAYWCFWGAVAFYLYTQRELFQPAFDYGEIVWNRDPKAPAQLPVLAGTVSRIYTSDGFQIRDDSRMSYNYGLAGVAGPRTNLTSTLEERTFYREAVTNLARLLLGERVRIEVTLANPETSTGLGVTLIGETNVNERVLAQGYGTLRREQIRGLPVKGQYTLVRAERLARKQRLGLWANATSDAVGAALTETSQPPASVAE